MKLLKLLFSAMMVCGLAPSFGQTTAADQKDVAVSTRPPIASPDGSLTGDDREAPSIRLAQATAGQSTGVAAEQPPGTAQTSARSSSLEEVIVTAQKTEQPLLTVPVPVTAISADSLVRSNLVTLQSYFQSIPSVNLVTGGNGASFVSIRGMSTGAGIVNPTMTFTIDGIQFGSSSGYGGAFENIADMDPSNLERIEVLEGPQGTLYGSNSLSGLINYVTVDPSTTKSSGRIEAGLSSVQNADSPGYDVRAAGNFPLSDSVALRASAFVRETPGYIDNVVTGKDGANRVDAEGGYLALLIRPSDLWSLKLSALYQNTEAYGLAFADPTLGLGSLKQSNIPGTGLLHNSNQAYSAIFKAQLGKAQLTSLTAYSVNAGTQALDDTWAYGGFSQALFGVGGAKDLDRSKTNKFSQEVRLSLPVTGWLDWMVGLFYAYEDTHTEQDIWGADPITGQFLPAWNVILASWPSTLNQEALFTNFTVHFTDRFDVQLGGRESINRQTYSEVDGGGFSSIFGVSNSPLGLVTPQVDTKDSAFTYLITPRYRFTPDVMLYARVATGFRNGGPNPTCTAFDLPCHFDPDRTHDYEVGLKAAFLEHRLVVDTSIFYMPWKNIQLPYNPPCGCASTVINAGDAKSQGIELKVDGRPTPDLTLSGWFDYNDAVMTSVSFAGIGFVYEPGTSLPFSSKYSAHLDAQQNFEISSEATLSVGAQASYVGSRAGGISSSPTLVHFPGYVQTDLRAELALNSWQFMVYANNVANTRGITGSLIPLQQYNAYIQPRTIGVSVVKNF